MLEYA
jgi:hypothetical protein